MKQNESNALAGKCLQRATHFIVTTMMLAVPCLLLDTPALAQGDDCSTARQISGSGPHWEVDFSNNTGSGYVPSGGTQTCSQPSDFVVDEFFVWTATVAGDYAFLFSNDHQDSIMNVYRGGDCNAICQGSDRRVKFGGPLIFLQVYGIAAGEQLLIQVGTFSPVVPGVEEFWVNDNLTSFCNSPAWAETPGYEPNNSCSTAVVFPAGNENELLVSNGNIDYYEVSLPPLALGCLGVGARSVFAPPVIRVLDENCNEVYSSQSWGRQSWEGLNSTQVEQKYILEVRPHPQSGPCSPYNMRWRLHDASCVAEGPDGFEPNDDCAMAPHMMNGRHYGLNISPGELDSYKLCVADGETVRCSAVREGFGGPHGTTESWLWLAGSQDCGTDGQFGTNGLLDSGAVSVSWRNTTGLDTEVVATFRWEPSSLLTCYSYWLYVESSSCSGGNSMEAFCSAMDTNSTGQSTSLTGAAGSGVGSGLHLEATQGPSSQFGYFLVGTGAVEPGVALSQGRFCLAQTGGEQFGRYNVSGGPLISIGQFDVSGVLQNTVGTSTTGSGFDVPLEVPSIGGLITAGETWHFQLWHREDMGESNFSNGLSVTF